MNAGANRLDHALEGKPGNIEADSQVNTLLADIRNQVLSLDLSWILRERLRCLAAKPPIVSDRLTQTKCEIWRKAPSGPSTLYGP